MSIPTWAKTLLLAAAIAALFFAVNWYNGHQQDIGYQRAVGEYAQKENQALREALAETECLKLKVKESEDAAKLREVARQQSDARIASLSQRLRDTESAIAERVSSAANSALVEATLAYGILFSECREAYAGMGRAAHGHSEDARTLIEAWPN